jgi:K+-transporting ATPase ATPase A chain
VFLTLEFIQLFVFFALLIASIPLLGNYMSKVFQGERTFAHYPLAWLENISYKIGGINPKLEMSCNDYTKALLWFNLFGFLTVFSLMLFQFYLPLNPEKMAGTSLSLAFNTAISFVTNTNWQSYSGENTLSYLTQMTGLAVQNFMSAATGFAVLLALIRGIYRKSCDTIGNFWVDVVRSIVYIFLPLSILLAVVLVGNGVVQTFSPYVEVTTLENVKQVIPLGPVASQVAIKQLGTNGGGFFGANSAHPFENPNALTNFLELLSILLIPAGTVYMYGQMIKDKKHALLVLVVMLVLFILGLSITFYSENIATFQHLEGRETRFVGVNSFFWIVSTTAASNGSVNAMIESMSPLAGAVALFNMMIGEIVFGGIGVGLCGMIMFAILTVFLSGLMVGRTPEFLGKKIRKSEIQWVMVAILTPCVLILVGSGISCVIPQGLASLGNEGPHGLSEILYAFTSAASNNGSSFGGLKANTPYYNIFRIRDVNR